jgi:hypothetical protein
MTQMSSEAEDALRSAKDWNMGTKVTSALQELQALGMVGPGAGLTRRGSIKAERLQRAQLDALFG